MLCFSEVLNTERPDLLGGWVSASLKGKVDIDMHVDGIEKLL